MTRIGIYKGDDAAFFGCDDSTLLDSLREAAEGIAGCPVRKDDPEPGIQATRVAEIAVVPVEDADTYQVKAGDTETDKPATGRTPNGQPGSWAIQSLVFSKEHYSLAQAQGWIKSHKQFGDYGVDETDTSYRFRQYDPGYFSRFRTFDLAEGITAIYGLVKQGDKRDTTDAEKDVSSSMRDHAAVQALNAQILKRKIQLLAGTEQLEKADEEEGEERFILGLVLEPNDGDNGAPMKPDTQGDIYSAADIRKSAHGWMERYGSVDLMHSWQALGAKDVSILESYIAPSNCEIGEGDDAYQVVEGSWLVALRVHSSDIWEAIKAGEIGAFSVGGNAVREEIE